MKITDLVGYQLVDLNEDEIIVQKDKRRFSIKIEDDYGDCCGYNNIEAHLYVGGEVKRNPIITDVTKENEDIDRSDKCCITFFGEDKILAKLETESSSGSGWCYGAAVTLKCKNLKIDEVLSVW